MHKRVKYCVYEWTPGGKYWKWSSSYQTLTEAWLSLPLWLATASNPRPPPRIAIVKLSVDLIAPDTLYSDTVRDHRIWDPRDADGVPALRKLPVRDPSTPRL